MLEALVIFFYFFYGRKKISAVCQNAAVCFDNFHYYSGYYGDIKLRIYYYYYPQNYKKVFSLLCTCVTYMMRLYKENIMVEKEQQNKWKKWRNFL